MKKYFFLALVLLLPVVVLAAPSLSFSPTPDDEYNPDDGNFSVVVSLSGYVEDTEVNFTVKGPLGHAQQATEVVDTYEYITNGLHEFTWDGTVGALDGEPGTYELSFSGEDLYGGDTNVLIHALTIPEPEPEPEEEEVTEEEEEPATDPEPLPPTPEPTPTPTPTPTPAPTTENTETNTTDEDASDNLDEADATEEDEDTEDTDSMTLWWWIAGGAIVLLGLFYGFKQSRGGTQTPTGGDQNQGQ